jgi:hypothetical protein
LPLVVRPHLARYAIGLVANRDIIASFLANFYDVSFEIACDVNSAGNDLERAVAPALTGAPGRRSSS